MKDFAYLITAAAHHNSNSAVELEKLDLLVSASRTIFLILLHSVFRSLLSLHLLRTLTLCFPHSLLFSPEKLGWDIKDSIQEDLSCFLSGHSPEDFSPDLVFTQQLCGNKQLLVPL